MASRIAVLGISLVAILGMHAASISPQRDWYNQFYWLDWILHFAGGAWAAYFFVVFSPKVRPLGIILFALAAGIAWEVLEYIFNTPFLGVGEASFADSLWILDTLADLFFDTVAAALVALLSSRYTRSNV